MNYTEYTADWNP